MMVGWNVQVKCVTCTKSGWRTQGHGKLGKVTCRTSQQTQAGLCCSSCCRKKGAEEKVLALRSSQFKLSTQLAKALLGLDDDGGPSCQAMASRNSRWPAALSHPPPDLCKVSLSLHTHSKEWLCFPWFSPSAFPPFFNAHYIPGRPQPAAQHIFT